MCHSDLMALIEWGGEVDKLLVFFGGAVILTWSLITRQ